MDNPAGLCAHSSTPGDTAGDGTGRGVLSRYGEHTVGSWAGRGACRWLEGHSKALLMAKPLYLPAQPWSLSRELAQAP